MVRLATCYVSIADQTNLHETRSWCINRAQWTRNLIRCTAISSDIPTQPVVSGRRGDCQLSQPLSLISIEERWRCLRCDRKLCLLVLLAFKRGWYRAVQSLRTAFSKLSSQLTRHTSVFSVIDRHSYQSINLPSESQLLSRLAWFYSSRMCG